MRWRASWRGAARRCGCSRRARSGPGRRRPRPAFSRPTSRDTTAGCCSTSAFVRSALYDDFVRDVCDESGLTVEYRRCGTLEVATDAATAARLRQSAAGDPHLRVARPGRGARPGGAPSQPRSKGPLLAPEHGYVAVPSLMDALAWAALRHGVQIEAAHRVTGDPRRRQAARRSPPRTARRGRRERS